MSNFRGFFPAVFLKYFPEFHFKFNNALYKQIYGVVM